MNSPSKIHKTRPASRQWPNEDPVGRRIKIGYFDSAEPWLTIVGVAQDGRQGGLDRPARAQFFRPYNQAAWPTMTVVVRTASSPAALVNPIKVDPMIALRSE